MNRIPRVYDRSTSYIGGNKQSPSGRGRPGGKTGFSYDSSNDTRPISDAQFDKFLLPLARQVVELRAQLIQLSLNWEFSEGQLTPPTVIRLRAAGDMAVTAEQLGEGQCSLKILRQQWYKVEDILGDMDLKRYQVDRIAQEYKDECSVLRLRIKGIRAIQRFDKAVAREGSTPNETVRIGDREVSRTAGFVPDGVYRVGSLIYKVKKAIYGTGRQVAYVLRIDDGFDDSVGWSVRRAKWKFFYAGLATKFIPVDLNTGQLIPRMTLEEAREFGKLYGVCCKCSATLTDELSIAEGIGPICGGRAFKRYDKHGNWTWRSSKTALKGRADLGMTFSGVWTGN